MHLARLISTIDVHAAGWALRTLVLADPCDLKLTAKERAMKLWNAEASVLRRLVHEPRGHAAMRLGVLQPTANNRGSGLLVFDADGACPADAMDALCAAEARKNWVAASDAESEREPIVTDDFVFRFGAESQGEGTKTVVGAPAYVEANGLPFSTPQGQYLADLARCGGRLYVIADASAAGLPLTPGNAIGLQRFARELASQTFAGRIVLADIAETGDETCIAVFGEDGQLMRGPEGGAVGALLATQSKRFVPAGHAVRFRCLSGGTVAGIAQDRSDEFGLQWSLSGQAFVTAACQFAVDPADPLREGFLLR